MCSCSGFIPDSNWITPRAPAVLAFEYPALANASAMATSDLVGLSMWSRLSNHHLMRCRNHLLRLHKDFPTLLVRAATLPETALTTFMTIKPFNPTSNAAPAAMSFVLVFKG